MKKRIFITLGIVLALLLVAGGVWYYYHYYQHPSQPTQEVQPKQHPKTIHANSLDTYEEESTANPLLVGTWSEEANPLHYKVYYEDPCDEPEGYFWGKEWDENDDVYEEDLTYHGNGWFKWNITDDEITEIYSFDLNSSAVPINYLIEELNDSIYVYDEFEVAKTIHRKNKRIPVRVFRYFRVEN